MNLYLVQFDNQSYYVEADNFTAAITAWKASWEPGEYEGEEPESVAIIHDEPVIRAAAILAERPDGS